MCVARRRKRALLQLSQFTPVQYPKGLRYRGVGRYENPGEHILMCSPGWEMFNLGGKLPPPCCPPSGVPVYHESYKIALTMSLLSHATAPLHNTCNEKKKKSCMCCSRFFSVDFWSNFYLQNTWVRLAQVFLGPLCVEMGFYADISWESRCYIEINIWAHFYKILLLFEVPYRPGVKAMPGKS